MALWLPPPLLRDHPAGPCLDRPGAHTVAAAPHRHPAQPVGARRLSLSKDQQPGNIAGPSMIMHVLVSLHSLMNCTCPAILMTVMANLTVLLSVPSVGLRCSRLTTTLARKMQWIVGGHMLLRCPVMMPPGRPGYLCVSALREDLICAPAPALWRRCWRRLRPSRFCPVGLGRVVCVTVSPGPGLAIARSAGCRPCA